MYGEIRRLTKSIRIKLPEVYGINKIVDKNLLPEKKKIAPQVKRGS